MKDIRQDEPLIQYLQTVIRWSVRLLAILMVFVIIMGVVDVGWTLYQKLVTPPMFILSMADILASFGAFMAVLIAIEIFVNITIYLREDIIHVRIVMATALMAIGRKVITLDMKEVQSTQMLGIAAIVIAVSAGYWLVVKLPRFELDPSANERSTHPSGDPAGEKSIGEIVVD